MKARFPLFGRILVWFFLNLLVLAAVFYALFSAQLRLGLDSLLAGRAGARLQAVGEAIVGELKDRPPAEWSGVLKNFGKAHQVQFYLFGIDGQQAAGEPVTLPKEVADKAIEPRGAGMGRGPPPGRGPGRRMELAAAAPLPPFMVRAGDPAQYWVGLRVPLTDESQIRPCPLVLLLGSRTLQAGGLFFDPTPWLIVGGGALLFSVLFWLPLARGLTRSIAQMTAATEQIAAGRFDVRVDEGRRDELGRLGLAINRMAARLSGFVTGQKRFLGDTAHELCSPIARMQVALGVLEARADERQKAYVADVREDLEQMSHLVNELLAFSKAGLQPKTARLEPVRVAEVARRVAVRESAADGRVEVLAGDDLEVLAEPELLARALANLVRNALRYAGHAGPVTVAAVARDGQVRITVADRGPGVPEAALPQIFDPFYRGEASRSRDTGGVGLGLAIVKTCIEACQGTVTARNRQPAGLEVELVLRGTEGGGSGPAGGSVFAQGGGDGQAGGAQGGKQAAEQADEGRPGNRLAQ